MALDAERLTTAILDTWYGPDDEHGAGAGFNTEMSKDDIMVFLRPQILAIAKEVINELLANAEVDGSKIK